MDTLGRASVTEAGLRLRPARPFYNSDGMPSGRSSDGIPA